jgi:hypothetical protein
MAIDTSKAIKGFQNNYLIAAIESGPVGTIRAANSVAVYSQMLHVLLMVTEPVVSGWKLRMLDSRSDALLLRSLAVLVNNSNKEQRRLADLDLLEACFNRVSQRCPSAFNHMTGAQPRTN